MKTSLPATSVANAINAKFTVLFKNGSIETLEPGSLEETYRFILDSEKDEDIDLVILPGDIELPFNLYAFHKCFDHGSITEEELVQILTSDALNKKGGHDE